MCIYILKTLRVTAVSEGYGLIFGKGEIKESAGTMRIHEETKDLQFLEDSHERPGVSLGCPGSSELERGRSTAVDT